MDIRQKLWMTEGVKKYYPTFGNNVGENCEFFYIRLLPHRPLQGSFHSIGRAPMLTYYLLLYNNFNIAKLHVQL